MFESAFTLVAHAPGGLALACPRCRRPLSPTADLARCPECALRFTRERGVWRFLPPERELDLRRFIAEYRAVRRGEGWGSAGPAYYLALPFRDLSGRFEEIWRIRAASFSTLLRRVVVPLERERQRPLTALDLGAGNGWLSHRLAELGHSLAAVDLSDDPRDGLGAHTWYPTRFTPVLADFDHLPFVADQADLAVFNASLHYSPDVRRTLAEAFRVLREDGVVAVVDTPVYRDPRSGARMVLEQQRRFRDVHGVSGTGGAGEGFLLYRRVRELAATLGLRAKLLRPVRWWPMRGRALLAGARGRRETATFPVVVMRRAGRREGHDAAR